VVIEVSDDGAGIAVEKVRRKPSSADSSRRSAPRNSASASCCSLSFCPASPPPPPVTNVSGRGVGMDVVRTNVEKIGGKVEIDSRPGKGATLRMRIPLTLAIIPALIVRSISQSFALPQGALSELVHIPPERAARGHRMDGRRAALPAARPAAPAGLSGPAADAGRASCKLATDRDNFIAVLDADGRRFGLVVDSLADPEEIVVKPLSAVLKDIGIYSGATVLGNADLALILDPGAIAVKAGVTMTQRRRKRARRGRGRAKPPSRTHAFLLVEVAGRRAAVPLADVLRIEQLPLSRIEYIGYRPVLNFEGQLLPVEDSGGVLAAAEGDPEAQIMVVVCREGNRHVGIAVSHVLDVASGGDLFEAGTASAPKGSRC
jgi:two-component system chemotaxis sensor kinase CheA